VSCNLLLQSIDEISVSSGQSWQMLSRQQVLIIIGFGQYSNAQLIKAKTAGWN
jgi:hypothetical protein